MNYNFHESLDDPINRLINAMEPETYLRPHRHKNPDKNEVFLLLTSVLDNQYFHTGRVCNAKSGRWKTISVSGLQKPAV
jgi:cupin fold WbuC family metalloprotein